MIIERPARYIRWFYPHATWRMDPNEHAVYLTFDDGPIPEATPFILKTLEAYGAKATFFVVGDNVRKYPELFQPNWYTPICSVRHMDGCDTVCITG